MTFSGIDVTSGRLVVFELKFVMRGGASSVLTMQTMAILRLTLWA